MNKEVEDFYAAHPELDNRHRPEGDPRHQKHNWALSEKLGPDGHRAQPWGDTGWVAQRRHRQGALWRAFDVTEREQSVKLERAIKTLAEDRQEVLRMYFWEGMTQTDMAKVLGVTQANVSRRIATAVKAVARALPSVVKDPVTWEEL